MTDQRIFLVRHGRTLLNADDRLRGLADPPLDEVGRAEAKATAESLRGRGIQIIYSSPLQRAAATAQIIAATLGVTTETDQRLNDRDYGPWTGHPKSEVVGEFGSVDAAPGVEPAASVIARVLPALDSISHQHEGEVIALVTHDAVIRPLLSAIEPGIGELTIATGSWNELARDDRGWRVESVDNTP